IYERFHRDKRVQAAELLLQEKIPVQPKIIRHPAMSYARRNIVKTENAPGQREFRNADTVVPEVCLLSNGAFTTMVTNSGSGFMRYKGMALSRWREDPVLDDWGNYIYIRDVTRNIVWSPSYHPCRVSPEEQRVQFSPDRATFMRVDQGIQTSLEICVSSEWNADVRRLTLTNTGNEDRIIEVTTFSELAMAFPMADDAHPAFNKLFVKTEYSPDIQSLLASRRSRHENEKTVWMAHSLMLTGRTLGPMEYETDRASFIGRGHSIAEPLGINSHLRGSVGSVTDPAFIMRQRISIAAGEQIQLYAVTAVADSKEEVVDIISRFSGELAVERAFQLAWNRSQIELRHLNLTTQEAMTIQALAGRVWYTSPLNKIRKQNIAVNTRGQSGLWCYGISGDLPIILVRIENRANMRFVVRLLTGHVYLRRMGCHFDLVILNESVDSYQEDLAEAIRRAVENSYEPHSTGLGDVFILHASHLPEEDRILLLSVAQMVFQAAGPSLRAQSKPPRKGADLPSLLRPKALPNRFPVSGKMLPHLLFYDGWGGFTRDGHEYMIIKNENHLPAPWINVLANPEFGCLISELGTGYTWWQNSRELKLTPWSNDPVLDQPGEMCYLRDEDSGELWSTVPFFSDSDNPYYVTHGWGYTHFSHERHGISHKMTVIVPSEEPIKILKVQLHNKTAERRTISVTYYAEWVLGVQRSKNAPYIVTEWDESSQTMLANNTFQEIFRNATGFLGIYPQTEKTSDPLIAKKAGTSRPDTELSWTADRLEFLGRNGTWKYPAALTRERLSGRTGSLYNTCGAVQAKIHMEPGTEQTVIIVLGCEDSSEAAIKLAQKYSRAEVCDEAFEMVRESWSQILGQITVSTPSPQMNILLNGWLLYQTIACRMWARSGFYQAGGAFGFRDQLQDSMALLHSRPDLTRKQILFHARHQYEEGDVQHWWHKETECGIRTQFTDDYLWLPYAVGRYVISTGDYTLLEEVVPYLSSEPLREGEYERYEPTCISSCSESIIEHCFRAIDKALDRFGEHGLPLIGIGDWNDGISRVGAMGRGESVWLGWFLYEVLNLFIDICDRQNDTVQVKKFQEVQEKLASALNENGWDGQWYRRAFTDSGEWLGSIYNEECRIDGIALAWAFISGAAPLDKAQQAMQSFDRELVDYELSLVHLLTPPFENTKPSPGYIQGYPPGIRENGAQYTHGAIWGIIAWCQLGNGVKAFELFDLLNPINHARTATEVRQYTGEPYVMAADVYTADPHKGCAGWTWYTGAAGWMYQAGIDWILGLRRRGNRLYINPCIPNQWPEYTVTYRYGTTRYQKLISNPYRKSTGFTEMKIDGIKMLSAESEVEPFIELIDDGKNHDVVVIM
ncbi:MAG: glycosyl transferase family 36, partial [Syntrophomonadaceae bacterium]|nr:glycosyl transferase family 36 [Syntrophomonadaceae bacterium]